MSSGDVLVEATVAVGLQVAPATGRPCLSEPSCERRRRAAAAADCREAAPVCYMSRGSSLHPGRFHPAPLGRAPARTHPIPRTPAGALALFSDEEREGPAPPPPPGISLAPGALRMRGAF